MNQALAILIVEDHDPLRQILAELVLERGWTPFHTDQGSEALRLARQHKLDIGLFDLHLPGSCSGLDLFQAINREVGPLPAIMMSGEASPTETHAALAAGVFSFLRKPIVIRHLQNSLDQLVQQHFPPFPTPPGQLAG